MDSLQIQDTFTPYYAKPDVTKQAPDGRLDATLSRTKLRQRLELCRNRLASAIGDTGAGKA